MLFVKSLVDLQAHGPIDFSTCIRLSFDQLMRTFRLKILDTINNGDVTEKKEGKPYWTGTKRRPNPVVFSPDNNLCMEFLYATANLFSRVFGLPAVRDRRHFEAAVRAMNLVQPEWNASQAGVGASEEGEADVPVDAGDLASLRAALHQVDTRELQLAHPQSFEKDDDDNFHIDYLTIATNLRSWNYNIKPTERHAVKVTAGRIIPALATTTAMVCGLVNIEFCKLVLGLQNLGSHKFLSSNINLATGSEAFSVFNPKPPIVKPMGVARAGQPLTFTSWDKLDYYEADRSAAEVSAMLANDFGVVVKKFSAETNYHPAKVVPLWSEGQDASKLLSQVSCMFACDVCAPGVPRCADARACARAFASLVCRSCVRRHSSRRSCWAKSRTTAPHRTRSASSPSSRSCKQSPLRGSSASCPSTTTTTLSK